MCRAYVAGTTEAKIAEKFGVEQPTVSRILATQESLDYMKALEAPVEAKLVELERLAVAVKEEILRLAFKPDATPKELELASDAATDMLNRRGQRGTPVTKSEAKTLAVSSVDLDGLLARVQADPGTRKILDANPEVKAQLALPATKQSPEG